MTTVLAIHSGGFTSRQWKKLARLLEPTYQVLAPDLIGYGELPWPVGQPFQFHQDVDRLAGLLTEPVHIVGHSYGGLLGAQLALAHPAMVRSLALYEPVAFGVLDEPADAPIRASIDALGAYLPDARGVDEGWLTRFVDWWQGAGAWSALAAPTRQGFRDVGWKLSQEVASLTADRTDCASYARIAVPTLLLGGERTPAEERHVLAKLAKALPHAVLRLFPELGHMGPVTAPDLVNAAIAAHLAAQPA